MEINKRKIEFYSNNKKNTGDEYIGKAKVLLESLPYIKEYFNKTVVVKIGGTMMENDSVLKSVLDDVILMKYVGIKVVLIHGGGKQITDLMKEKGLDVKFIDGMRVTTKESMDIVKMILIGKINTKVVSFLNEHDKEAIGISGNDASFIKCRKKRYKKNGKDIDLGYVGEIIDIDSNFVVNILDNGYIPVITSLGTDANGNIYNINADSCAYKIAAFLKAKKMILLTDVDGIIYFSNSSKKLVSRLTSKKCLDMIKSGDISSGMIPKVMSCIDALHSGVSRTHILNGTKAHSILVEIFTDKGIGTMITA
ncbi:MAG: acetylglutamate kinase [Actinobacteria bacterium]|nr:acetylglutamate kinase [Actinomycetota bacterium]MBL7060605.1 acetylglutamate kinase [Actinomycetota bacterium]